MGEPEKQPDRRRWWQFRLHEALVLLGLVSVLLAINVLSIRFFTSPGSPYLYEYTGQTTLLILFDACTLFAIIAWLAGDRR